MPQDNGFDGIGELDHEKHPTLQHCFSAPSKTDKQKWRQQPQSSRVCLKERVLINMDTPCRGCYCSTSFFISACSLVFLMADLIDRYFTLVGSNHQRINEQVVFAACNHEYVHNVSLYFPPKN